MSTCAALWLMWASAGHKEWYEIATPAWSGLAMTAIEFFQHTRKRESRPDFVCFPEFLPVQDPENPDFKLQNLLLGDFYPKSLKNMIPI